MVAPAAPETDDALPRTLPDDSETEGGALVGAVLGGRYRCQSLLGRGGHAEVWDADDLLTRDHVAVKILRRRAEISAARARREISVLRFLRVPGVVRLIDEGVDAGRAFIVMERVEGKHFPGAGGARSWSEVRGPALGLLETLARIHAAGVVHRDLKPANVLVDAAGRPTVLDFGLSYLDVQDTGKLTADREMLGTPAYLAPEQINGDSITPRTDLYAVGVMLYEALTGRLPHEAPDLRRLMRVRLTQAPTPLRDAAPEVPETIANAVDRLLATAAEDRPRSAHDVLALLRGDASIEAPSFPRLGGDHHVRALLDALSRGVSRDVTGAPGSGRSRLLHDVAAVLASQGRRLLRLSVARRPFASLQPLTGEHPPPSGASLDEVTRTLEAHVRSVLREGTVIVADDADRIDAASADLLERCATEGPVIRAFAGPPRRGATHLLPLEEYDLQPLFAGPDRVLHLREDAARALFTRTEGNARRVVDEIESWVRAGLCRWDGDRVVIARDALDRLDDGLRVGAGIDDPSEALPQHLAETLAWITLSGSDASISLLARAAQEPHWRVEAEVRELCARGAAKLSPDGAVEPRARIRLEELWSETRRRAASRALAESLPPGAPTRLGHLVAASEGTRDDGLAIAAEACARARGLASEGHLGRAVLALGDGLRVLRESDHDPRDTDALLSRWVEIATSEGTARALDRVLYEICRIEPRTTHGQRLEAFVRAALGVNVWSDRALDAVESIEPFDDRGLERQRQAVRVAAARRASLAREEAVLAGIADVIERGDDRAGRAALAGWRGRLLYRRGEFEAAARMQSSAAAEAEWVTARLAAQLNAASAYMEAFRLDEARTTATQARALARKCRHAFAEARAEWVLRSVAYRTGEARLADRELLESVAALSAPDLEAMVALGEAAVAYRAGESGTVRELARRAHRIWTESGESLGALLAASLLHAEGERGSASAAELARRAVDCPTRGVGIQALGLIARGGERPEVPRETVSALAEGVPREHWNEPLEILSVREALDAFG